MKTNTIFLISKFLLSLEKLNIWLNFIGNLKYFSVSGIRHFLDTRYIPQFSKH